MRGVQYLIPSWNLSPSSGLFSVNALLADYISFAYNILDSNEVVAIQKNLPKWAGDGPWDIEARSEGTPTREELRLMMQALLKDRFKLAVHYEKKRFPIYAMVLVKPGRLGPQLHEMKSPCADPKAQHGSVAGRTPALLCGTKTWYDRDGIHLDMVGASLDETASFISSASLADRTIVNRTGLAGKYDVQLTYGAGASLDGEGPGNSPGPTIREALDKELGLKLVTDTASGSTLIVDHIDKPTPN